MRGGTTLSIGQLLEAADRDAREMRAQGGQAKTAQAASPEVDLDLLSTPSVLALAQAGRKLASRMKTAEDDMEGPSGVNTGSASPGMKDSLTPSAETPRQFYVEPSGKVDVSPSDNRFSIPTQTEQKAPEPSMNPGVSTPGQFLAPKIGQAGFAVGSEVGAGRAPLPGRVSGTPDASQRTDVAPDPGIRAGRSAVEQAANKEGAAQKRAQDVLRSGDTVPVMQIQGRLPGAMDFEGGGPVGESPVGLAPRFVPEGPALRTAVPAGTAAAERGTEKTQSLDPIRAVHERYSRAAAALAKHAQPGGEAQPTTETGPMVGPGKPEAHSPSGDTTGGDKPPTSYEGVRETSRQDADAKALADASAQTDLPLAAAKETTEGVLDEVLKAASFREFFATLDPGSKIASLLRNRLIQKQAQEMMQSGATLPPLQIQGRLPGTMSFEGGGPVGGSPVGLTPRFVPEGPPLRTAVEAGQEAVGRGVNQTTGGPSMAPPVMIPTPAKVPGAQGGLKGQGGLRGMTDEMNQAWNLLSPSGQGL